MQGLSAVVLLSVVSVAASAFHQKDLNEETVIASHWQQLSGEYRACFYQTFNGARDHLAKALQQVPEGKKPAIITDIDETLVNGSAYFSSLTGTDDTHSAERSRYWWNNQVPEILPGALEFIRHAHDLGVDIFYISGRFEDVKPATINILTKLGFPVADEDHVLLQPASNTTLDKESKRQAVRDLDYHILMILGDQLDDLAEVKGTLAGERKDWVSANRDRFGQQWYILPNAVYGAWENSIAPDYKKMSPEEKHLARTNAPGYKMNYLNISDPVYASHRLLADVWQQVSADFVAFAYQAFNQARRVLKQQQNTLENPAIVVDIDGTILDYTPMYPSPIHKDSPADNHHELRFLQTQETARKMPGAKKFLDAAKAMGYEIFYVSDRPNSTRRPGQENDIKEASVRKLAKHGFPCADSKHVMLRNDFCPPDTVPCGKEFKRQAITEGKIDDTKYNVTLYVGDLLTDFPLTEQALPPLEKSSAEATRSLFGREYIIIPNTVSSSWMRYTYSKAAGKNIRELNMAQQAELRRQLVQDWEHKNNYKRNIVPGKD